jgi:tetratricopeptide (TPR) repeat protein
LQNLLQIKIDDFAEWASVSFEHFQRKHYADALTNMRKAGEAACKLIVIYKYTQKIAEEKIANKSLRELMELLIDDALAPRKAIHWFEALQIHGNTATHDNRITEEQAQFGTLALKMLVHWMFEEHLKIAIPSRLKNLLSEEKQIEPDTEKEKLRQELTLIKKEKGALERKVQQSAQDVDRLQNQFGEILKRMEEMKQAGQKTSELEKELAQAKSEMEHIRETALSNDKKEIPIKRRNTKRYVFIGASVIFIFAIIFFTNQYWKNNHPSAVPTETASPSDSSTILILPFAVLQDNPNVVVKFEDNIKRSIIQQSLALRIPVRVLFQPQLHNPPQTYEDAFKEGEKSKAIVVFYGDIYEFADSTQVNARWLLVSKENPLKGETGVKSFSSLSDAKASTLQQEITCIVNLALSADKIGYAKFSDALSILYKTIPISNFEKESYYDLVGSCHYYLKNYSAAKKEVAKLIRAMPDTAYGYAFMANIMKETREYDSARIYYEKSLALDPSNVNTLYNYADMLARPDIKKYDQAQRLLLQALHYDTTNAFFLRALGDIAGYKNDFSKAVSYYQKSLSNNPKDNAAKKNMANIFAFQFHKAQDAVALLEEVVKSDSTDARALFILGNIYSTEIHNTEKADYYFKKSKKYNTVEDAGTYFGLGITAYDKKDYKTAEENYLKAYRLDSNNYELCNSIAQLYLDKRNFTQAKRYLLHAQKIDSLGWLTNFNLGTWYAGADKQADYKKAAYYFEKVLQTNPYDAATLELLSNMKVNEGKTAEAKKLLLHLLEFASENYIGNKLLGTIYIRETEYVKAKPLIEKAIKANPADYESYSFLAVCLMRLSNNTDVQNALQYASKSVSLEPNCADCQYRLAEIYANGRIWMKAKEHYEIAIALSPSLKNEEMEKALAQHN